MADIRALIANLPTYGYRRVHALLRRQAENDGRPAPHAKRVHRVMKLHRLLLQRHSGCGEERRHDGRVAVDERNTRWCSDGLEIGCENGGKVQVAFALDGCDREAMGYAATTAGISAQDVRDLMVACVEHRFGQVNRRPSPTEWLTDNGSCFTARETRRFARDMGLIARTMRIKSPQSNGMAEAFVRTLKRDYVRVSSKPDARSVLEQPPGWIAHYNTVHPHRPGLLLPERVHHPFNPGGLDRPLGGNSNGRLRLLLQGRHRRRLERALAAAGFRGTSSSPTGLTHCSRSGVRFRPCLAGLSRLRGPQRA